MAFHVTKAPHQPAGQSLLKHASKPQLVLQIRNSGCPHLPVRHVAAQPGVARASCAMVEGPGCTNNGRKARHHVGKRVLGVNGHEGSKVVDAVRQRCLIDVLTLGKELWLVFGEPTALHGSQGVDEPSNDAGLGSPSAISSSSGSGSGNAGDLCTTSSSGRRGTTETAVRLHFGMNGSLHVDASEPRFSGATLTLGLVFEGGHRLRAFQSTACVEPRAAAVRAKHEDGAGRDVCAEDAVFDHLACVAAVARQPPSALICDVVLDQAILPGAWCGMQGHDHLAGHCSDRETQAR